MYKFIDNRSHSKLKPHHIYDLAKDNSGLLQRMSLLHRLEIHRGCVNTISWDEEGELILSGSDDHNLILSNAFSGNTIAKLHTAHRSNIFSAKFLPNSNNSKIISCSGGGLVLYTDVEHHTDSDSRFSFSCHSGTCFEVLTVPGCSNSFLSCGEDGTVRYTDLRIKSSCTQSLCQEDILLNMGQAVTSMAMNDVKPYHLAISTPDSMIRIYDRRKLSLKSGNMKSNTSSALLMGLIPSSLDGKNRRTTFIDYNSLGTEILATYSAENVYLFDLEDSESFAPAHAEADPPTYEDDEYPCGPTLKRLRLRGDWSDTGPSALPESELRFQTGDVGQYRPALQSTLMQRMTDVLSTMLQNPSVREAARMASRHRDEGGEEGGAEGGDREFPIDAPAEEESTPPRPVNNSSPDESDLPSDEAAADGGDGESSPFVTDTGVESAPMDSTVAEPSVAGSSRGNVASNSSKSIFAPSTPSGTEFSQQRDLSPMQTNADESTPAQSVSNIRDNVIGEDHSRADLESEPILERGLPTEAADALQLPSTSSAGPSNPRDDSSSNADSSSRTDEHGQNERPKGTARQRMVKAIGKVVRLAKQREARMVDDPQFRNVVYGKEARQYIGHRNARTMIKEACFWGNEHVMSGSDCGRVFVWEKNTGRLVMLWEADRHVVNCLQPHPRLPVLATCGIDYDVKVWMPLCEEPHFDEVQAQNIVQRNDAIQAEMRDTVTVPATFMIRMLASLNQIRQDRTRQRESEED